MPINSMIAAERIRYHQQLVERNILTVDNYGVASNADCDSTDSVKFAKGIIDRLSVDIGEPRSKLKGQTLGRFYEVLNRDYLSEVFPAIEPFRPATWHIERFGNSKKTQISKFEQYSHLADLERISDANPELQTALGTDYLVGPDVIIYREPLSDEQLNAFDFLVDDENALKTMLRKSNGGSDILHASVSAKWTIRSDRSQNSRTEALNLIRNRKGHLPHIVAVTAEPLPSRLASIALGTGDIDCVYHSFLYELVDTVNSVGSDDSINMLRIMIEGKRLKDISDLPLDLIV